MEKQVYLIPEKVEVVSTLPASLREPYAESVKSYNNPRARETLRNFGDSEGELAESNPFMISQLIKAGLLPKHLTHVAERRNLESAIARDPGFLRRTYNDFGLALVTPYDNWEPSKNGKKPNDLLAKKLTEELKSKKIELGTGKLIPFSALTIKEDNDSAYGLVFSLTDFATRETVLDLNQFSWNSIRDPDQGLARAYLNDAWSWNRGGGHLAGSSADGRVVGVRMVDTPKNLVLGYSDEKIKEALNQTGFSGATDSVLSYLQRHNN